MDNVELKSCPICELKFDEQLDDGTDPRPICPICGFMAYRQEWNTLPRCEEFYAELMKIVKYSRELESNVTVGTVGLVAINVRRALVVLAAKYAPKEMPS